ncbi:7-cyano-7-deazaguanine synthase, partial [Candidatus Micrarchaeota archaeon]|nr:7-cyano-7-deazaguanine synthase [Candidatus Micrarchaeota archaeon]
MKGLLLLSGGIDSPVAGILAGKKAEITALHFSSEKITGKQAKEKAEKLAELIKAKAFFSVDFSEELEKIVNSTERKFYFILMKRLMLKTAEKICEKNNFDFILTGENLGQVSSQTLDNLVSISFDVKKPIIRPLLSFDKQEIVDLAKNYGTYELSIGKETCDALGPNKPATRSIKEK